MILATCSNYNTILDKKTITIVTVYRAYASTELMLRNKVVKKKKKKHGYKNNTLGPRIFTVPNDVTHRCLFRAHCTRNMHSNINRRCCCPRLQRLIFISYARFLLLLFRL